MGERTCGEWFGRRSVRIVHNILHWYLGCERHCICSPSKWNAVFIVESIQDNDALFNHRNGNHEVTWLHVLYKINRSEHVCISFVSSKYSIGTPGLNVFIVFVFPKITCHYTHI